jgi:hypothetical protein
VPAHQSSIREKIYQMLVEAGPLGVSKEALIFEHGWTQCAARAFEINLAVAKQGKRIRSESRPGERYVWFILEAIPQGDDWYERERGPRPSGNTSDLPLFSGVRE